MNSVMEIGQKVVFIFEGQKLGKEATWIFWNLIIKILNDFVFATKLNEETLNKV